jgi:protein involved in polysaccharide export with SLBB domain
MAFVAKTVSTILTSGVPFLRKLAARSGTPTARTSHLSPITSNSLTFNPLPFLISALLFTGCATSNRIDWDTFMKELSSEHAVASDGIELNGPDAPVSELPPAPISTDTVVLAGEVTIQPDSVLQVAVLEDSGLDGSYHVNEISAIQLGYVGPVFLNEMTEEQAAIKIKEVLENRFFNRATVNVRILKASYDKVSLQGLVANSGIIKIGSGDRISLNDALLRVGNVTSAIKGTRIRIVRGGLVRAVSASEDGEIYSLLDEDGKPRVPDVHLWNNDVAYVYTGSSKKNGSKAVREGPKNILVLGEVNRQGFYKFPGSASCTLMTLIFKMNGFPTYANTKKIRIIRRTSDGDEEEMIIDASRILDEGDPDEDIGLENGDRIIVPARKLSLF